MPTQGRGAELGSPTLLHPGLTSAQPKQHKGTFCSGPHSCPSPSLMAPLGCPSCHPRPSPHQGTLAEQLSCSLGTLQPGLGPQAHAQGRVRSGAGNTWQAAAPPPPLLHTHSLSKSSYF